MGDILMPKRQAIVDRLRRRLENYRRRQNACLPIFEKSSNGMHEQQRQEALLLKQRFYESKVKKSKRNSDNNKSVCLTRDFVHQDRSLLAQQKSSKRQAKGSEALHTTNQDCDDHERQVKISRGVLTADHQETASIPSFSVQIVQQFNTSNTCQNPHQTIHTNVTVKALTGTVNNSSSPLTNNVSTNGADISVGTNVECKQEKETEDNNNSHPNGVVDRFADTFPNLVFPEDSADDVLHPDLFNRLIDDVFTNSADLMKEFNFGDAVSKDGEEVDKTLECVDAGVSPNTTTSPQVHFPPTPPMISPFSGSQSASPLFDTSNTVMTTTPSAPSYPQRVPSYSHSSSLGINAGLGLDFKLTEPSPAAQTLKQMAEQHQSMQQKQQQLGLGLSSPHSRSPFGTDTFPDPLTLPSMRSNFINGAASHLSPLQKSPTGSLFSTMGYVPPTDFHCIRTQPTTGVMYKPESNDNLFAGMENMGHMPDVGMHKRQVMLLPRIGPDGKQNPNYSPEQKSQYGGTRPLSHFTDSVSGSGPPPLSSPYAATQRSPSGPTLQMSQSQQINQSSPMQQMNPTGHSQPMTTTQQYPGYSQTPGSPSAGTFQITMSQSQSMSFSSPFGNRTTPSSGGMTNIQTPPQMIPHTQTDGMYLNRPPPDYKLQTIGDVGHHVIPNYGNVARNRVAGASSQVHRQVGNYRRADEPLLTQGGYLGKALGTNLQEPTLGSTEKSTYSNSPMKMQRPPNVNVGPEGLNISQRSSVSSSEWRPQLMQCPPRLPAQRPQYSQSYTNDLSRGMNSPQSTDKMQRYPSNQIMMQQHQQMALQGNVPNSAVNMQMSQSISMAAGVQMPNQIYPQTASTPQDGSQINIEFFDNIESSATDLLNFETESANSHFSLLDDIGRLGK